MKQIRKYDDGRVTLARKVQNIELCIPYQYLYQLATKISSFKLEGYSKLAMKSCFGSLGRSQGGHVMLSPFFQPRYSTVLKEKSNSLLPISSRYAAVNHYTLCSAWKVGITRLLCYSTVVTKTQIFANFNFIVLNQMDHALTSA